MSQNIFKQRIQSRIVIIRIDHALAKVVQDDASGTAPKPAKRSLVQLGPDSGTGAEPEQSDRFTAVAQRHHEQPGASVLARLRMAHHRPITVIDLSFFPGPVWMIPTAPGRWDPRSLRTKRFMD